MRRIALLLATLAPAVAQAAPLVLTKTSTVVADQVSTLNPKALPTATVDYAIQVDNPNSVLSAQTIRVVVIEDAIPTNVVLRVADYGLSGSGPVEFSDGSLLGLFGSALTYSFTNLASTTDGLEFYDGASWTYTPTPDAQGYDTKVRAIRVKLTGTQAAASSFRLRFRVRIK